MKKFLFNLVLLVFFTISMYYFYNMLPNFITKIFTRVDLSILELSKVIVSSYLLWYLFMLVFYKKKESNFYVVITMLINLFLMLFFLIISKPIVNNFLYFIIFFFITCLISLIIVNKVKKIIKPKKVIERYSLLVFPFIYLIFILFSFL